MSDVDPETWKILWDTVCELSDHYPDGVVFIGGVAVYLHARASRIPPSWVEFSHDGDLYISFADFADLRDIEDVVANRRLTKHQFIKRGVDFDVYLEHNNGLRVSYADVLEHSRVIDRVRVASLEHLLLLKLDAFADRKGTTKGRKDERDVIRLARLLAPPHRVVRAQIAAYASGGDVVRLRELERSREFAQVTGGNHKQASALRGDVDRLIRLVEREVQ